jgi:transposase InsO family protein
VLESGTLFEVTYREFHHGVTTVVGVEGNVVTIAVGNERVVAIGGEQRGPWITQLGATKLHGPEKWTYYYLYVILDIWSRYVTGWMLARAETAQVSTRLMNESIAKQGIVKGQLTIHTDSQRITDDRETGGASVGQPPGHQVAQSASREQ